MAADSPSCPSWVILNCLGQSKDSSTVDSNTAVVCRTSTGWLIRISFLFAAPPASSLLCYDWLGAAPGEDEYYEHPHVVAAHGGGSILIEMWVPPNRRIGCSSSVVVVDHFLYETGTTGGRPPSLSLLPACFFPMQFERTRTAKRTTARRLSTEDTGLLLLGDGELLVAQLEVTFDDPFDTAEICVLRSGWSKWKLWQAVPILRIDDGGQDKEPVRWRDTDAAVAVGDRFLCWVNYLWGGFLLCDMAEDASLKVWHVGLPVAVPEGVWKSNTHGPDRHRAKYSRNMAAAGGSTVRFVSVDPRCCCGGPGKSTCARSRTAFTVTTWTMELTAEEPMAWVKVGVLDCEELWALPAYESLPRVLLEYPVVSLDNPDVVCFVVCEDRFGGYEDTRAWKIEVDTRRKMLLSAIPCTPSRLWFGDTLLPVKLQL